MDPSQQVKCGAKSRTRGGAPCRAWAVRGRTRCRMHGGKSLRGADHPNWKDGLYSQALPQDVATAARRALADPTLRDMRQAIALTDARIVERLRDLHVGAGNWDAVTNALARLRTAGDDLNVTRKALDDIEAAATAGRTRDRAWRDLRDMFQERDKLLTGETNRHKVTADMITADRVATFMVGMVDALRDESQDRDLIRRVIGRWERLMGLAGVQVPAKGGTE